MRSASTSTSRAAIRVACPFKPPRIVPPSLIPGLGGSARAELDQHGAAFTLRACCSEHRGSSPCRGSTPESRISGPAVFRPKGRETIASGRQPLDFQGVAFPPSPSPESAMETLAYMVFASLIRGTRRNCPIASGPRGSRPLAIVSRPFGAKTRRPYFVGSGVGTRHVDRPPKTVASPHPFPDPRMKTEPSGLAARLRLRDRP